MTPAAQTGVPARAGRTNHSAWAEFLSMIDKDQDVPIVCPECRHVEEVEYRVSKYHIESHDRVFHDGERTAGILLTKDGGEQYALAPHPDHAAENFREWMGEQSTLPKAEIERRLNS